MKINKIIQNFLDGGFSQSLTYDLNLQKVRIVNGFGFIGTISLLYFGLNHIIYQDELLGTIELGLAVLTIVSLFQLRLNKKHEITSTIILLEMIFLMTVLLYRGGIADTGTYWIFTIPVLAFFTREPKEGVYFVTTMLTVILVFMFGQQIGIFVTAFEISNLVQLTASFIVISIMTYFYSIVLFNYQSDLVRVNEQSKDTLANLLKKNHDLNESQQKNELLLSDLNDFRKAMINLLDDLDVDREKLELSNQELSKYKLAVDNSQDLVLITDFDGVVLYANNATETITGFSIGEIIGKKSGTNELWGGQMSREFYKDMWYQISQEKKPFRAEIKNKRKNGEVYYAESQIVPLLDEKNEILFFVQIQHDITSRKLRELEVRRFQLAVENASDQIVITDPDGVVLYANPAIEKITGFKRQEVVGKKAGSKELWGGQMDKEFYDQMWDIIKNKKQTFLGDITNKRKNGAIYTAQTSLSPVVSDENGEILYFVGIERDITHEKEIDNMKTHFISLASHQLRTPLSAMRWFSEILLEGDTGELNQKQKEIVENIYESNNRMISLVNSLLNISRIESGRVIIDPIPTNISDLLNNLVSELKIKLDEKKQNISLSIENDLPIINLDKDLIRNVYLNLLTNSIKYSALESTINVYVKKDGNFLLSEVIDNGMGIADEDKDKVFQKFYRGANAIKSETDGSGLGLYLAKIIVETSGGKIWFESNIGEGSKFFFTIPLEGMKEQKGEVKVDA